MGVKKDKLKAKKLYKQSCDYGYYNACIKYNKIKK